MLWVLGDWELITIVATLVVMMQQCGATPPVLAQGGITVLLSSVLDVTEVTCEVLWRFGTKQLFTLSGWG